MNLTFKVRVEKVSKISVMFLSVRSKLSHSSEKNKPYRTIPLRARKEAHRLLKAFH